MRYMTAAMFIASTFSLATVCHAECDPTQDGDITASDSLLVLRAAVGQQEAVAECKASEPPSKLVFISSLTYNGNLGGLAGADEKCQALAAGAGLTGNYAAWLSDSTTDAVDRITAACGGYALVDGTVVATSFADLTDGTLVAPINRDENNVFVDERAWTGTSPLGTACFQGSGGNCNLTAPGNDGLVRTACENWTLAEDESEAVTGDNSATGNWTLEGDRACPDQHHLYCIQL